jgi:D-alanyl-D-alanine carboxypeptidase (penicillin-binding protein 5/6)
VTRRPILPAAVAVAALLGFAGVQAWRPLPAPRILGAIPSTFMFPGPPLKPAWPVFGQAALGVDGVGAVATSGAQTPVPIASVTKLMTALVVVRAHRLAPGQPGPEVTLTQGDQALYVQELAAGDSVVAVRAGETLTEQQLLEGLLIPSADNLARVLADWDAGSVPAFVAQMNQEARALGMRHTTFTDSSGLDPGSSSTASDLLRLAAAVMAQPALAAVADMPTAILPLAGVVHNYDFVLGQAGVVGLKTGWTSSSGGCFVAAAKDRIRGREQVVTAAVLGAPGGPIAAVRLAESAAVRLLESAVVRFTLRQVPSAIPELVSSWHSALPLRLSPVLDVVGWPALSLQVRLRRLRLGPGMHRGAAVAEIEVLSGAGRVGTTWLRLRSSLPPPSLWWRLTHF